MTTTITLESIKAEHAKIGDLIAAFEKQQETAALFFPEVTINLAPGEHYAGLILGKDGEQSYRLSSGDERSEVRLERWVRCWLVDKRKNR